MTQQESSVLEFLKRNPSCWINEKQKRLGCRMSHTFLDGTWSGKIYIPPTLVEEFERHVAKDVDSGTLPALNELRTDVFCFYVDYDIVTPENVEVDIDRVAAITTQQTRRFVETLTPLRTVVLDTPPVPRSGGTKHGMHLHFPTVHVTSHEALTMREAIIVALQRELPDVCKWEDAYDNSPYVNSVGGLRMLGAPKAQKCSECNNTPALRKECVNCLGRGRVVDRRVYALRSCLDAKGYVDFNLTQILMQNTAQLVRQTSIRTNANAVTPQWRAFDGCPSYSELKVTPGQAPRAGKRERVFSEETASKRKWPKSALTSPTKLSCIEKIFQTRFSTVYANVTISNARTSADGKKIFAQFSGEGESYCLNIGKNHRNNRVYGVIENRKAYLRCHCNCQTIEGRLSGKMCKDFVSNEKWLTPSDIDTLFDKSKSMPGQISPEEYLAKMSHALFG